jgi:hypothetical protein
MAVGTSVVLFAFGGGAALANGSHGAGGANSATQSATSTQLLPISAAPAVAVPVNANLPVGLLSTGSARGPVTQSAAAEARAAASNNATAQSIRQESARSAGSVRASGAELLPVGPGASAPSVRAVAQEARGQSSGSATNNATAQSVRQEGGANAASQRATSTQLLPIALGLGAAVPVNANAPVGLLGAGSGQGDLRQQAAARAAAEALNNATDQSVEQRGEGTGRNAADQSASNTQLLPIALGAALAIPVNANVPIAILSAGPVQGDVEQQADAGARARAVNNELGQSVRQRAGRDGSNAAGQRASSTQLLPIALGAALAIPVNANVPIAILSAGPVQGDVRQRANADAAVEALNNATEQSVRQDAGAGGQNAADQSAANTQVLPVALGAALALPINLNVPIAILSAGPVQGTVAQGGQANAAAQARTHELVQSVEQASGGDRNAASQSGTNTQVLPVALGPGLATPLNVNLPISILSNGQMLGVGGLDVVNVLANPLGLLGDPTGAVSGLLGAL